MPLSLSLDRNQSLMLNAFRLDAVRFDEFRDKLAASKARCHNWSELILDVCETFKDNDMWLCLALIQIGANIERQQQYTAGHIRI